ncbi:hypothetical protein GS934_12485 [Rhodococcus hoagii]|nr:hypothetical protein [Prescottella equi]NKZ87840.1 hypothetical protein [Prescottella equi]
MDTPSSRRAARPAAAPRALLAARFVPLATGTDTGGSLRLPASACGITSIKPTFGRCSAYGVIPLTWTRAIIRVRWPRSIADASLLLGHMAGADPNFPATYAAPSVPAEGYPLAATGGAQPLAGKRFGVARPQRRRPALDARHAVRRVPRSRAPSRRHRPLDVSLPIAAPTC